MSNRIGYGAACHRSLAAGLPDDRTTMRRRGAGAFIAPMTAGVQGSGLSAAGVRKGAEAGSAAFKAPPG
jgi:hypothetical protein